MKCHFTEYSVTFTLNPVGKFVYTYVCSCIPETPLQFYRTSLKVYILFKQRLNCSPNPNRAVIFFIYWNYVKNL